MPKLIEKGLYPENERSEA